MNGEYHVNRDVFLQPDEGGTGRRGRDQKLFNRRFRLDIYTF